MITKEERIKWRNVWRYHWMNQYGIRVISKRLPYYGKKVKFLNHLWLKHISICKIVCFFNQIPFTSCWK